MKYFLMVLAGYAFFTSAFTQTNFTHDYVITSSGGDLSSYSQAMDAANWEPYRLKNQRVVFSFDSGVTVELKSAVELLNLGYSINLNSYQESFPAGYKIPTLTLLSGNKVGMVVETPPVKTNKK